MKREQRRLSAKRVEKAQAPGMYADGDGLYLRVTESGTKNWVFRFRLHRKERRRGLGSFPTVTLADARVAAMESRQQLHKGEDPIAANKSAVRQRAQEAAKGRSFRDCAVKYIDGHKATWTNTKHINQWTNTLTTYAYPVIGDTPVQDIDVELVLQVLEPIWYEKTETATKVRQRIESILDWAQALGYRMGENPARWRGCMAKVLPSPNKVRQVKHFAAMSYTDLPCYYATLRDQDTPAALSLAFLILTATRSSEALGARWEEIDFEAGRWDIPAERMKARREHAIPLARETLDVLEKARQYSHNQVYVFPGLKIHKPISDTTVRNLLHSRHPELTLHGFRSTFRQWCAEKTGYPREVAEMALAHAIGNSTERAYQRSDLYEKRCKLMEDWACFCLQVEVASV